VAKPILNNPIVKNLSILVSGTVVAQLIVIVFQLLLRRVYTPQEFGAFAVYMSLMGIFATIASLRYEQAILLPKTDPKGFAVLVLSFFIALLTFLIFLLFTIFLKKPIGILINLDSVYYHWLYFLPVSILIFSVAQALNLFLIRQKKFGFSASNKGLRRFIEGSTQVSFGFAGKSFGLIMGDFIGQLLTSLNILRKLKLRNTYSINKTEIRDAAKKYKSFPINNGIPSLMNAISLLLPILIINRKFTAEVTGYFDLARMVLIIPLSLVTASLSQVLLQRFTEKRNANQSIKKDALGSFVSLSLIALLFGLIIQFFGKELFGLVFGEIWETSGLYASILVWAFAIKFVVSPFNMVFTAFERIGLLSVWQVFYFILIVLLIVLPFQSIESFLYTYLAIELVGYLLVGFMDMALVYTYEQAIKRKSINK
jgi:O-antigen/teichoic acid export membrane protein